MTGHLSPSPTSAPSPPPRYGHGLELFRRFSRILQLDFVVFTKQRTITCGFFAASRLSDRRQTALTPRSRGHYGTARSVCLSHGAAAQAIGTLAVSSLAIPPATRDVRTADSSANRRRSAAIFGPNCYRRRHIVSPPPGRYLVCRHQRVISKKTRTTKVLTGGRTDL